MGESFPYIYFVSYSFVVKKSGKKGFGYGMIDIHRKQPIKSFEDVISLKETIEEKGPENVVILNYRLMNC